MKLVALCVCALFAIHAASNVKAEAEPADAARYGPYPTNYKEIVTKWLQTQLIDATSAIEWKGDPKPADRGTKDEHLYGYLVEFSQSTPEIGLRYTGKPRRIDS